MADYGSLARGIYQAFTAINENSHASTNQDEKVTYPYLTYDIRTDPATESRNQENLIVDVQIHDTGKSYVRLYDFASEVTNGFKDLIVNKENLNIRFDVRLGASNWFQVPTEDPNIVRLEGTIQGKIDWREF